MRLFFMTLNRVIKRHNWILHAYCLMINHFHLLIETPDGNLSRGMHNLNGLYCQSYNSRHARVGHLFQGRYRATVIDQDEYFQTVARYIVLNPVAANLVTDPSQYVWSSYLDTIGARTPPAFLTIETILRSFSEDEVKARVYYQTFILQGLGEVFPNNGGKIGTNIKKALNFNVGNNIPNYLFVEYPEEEKVTVNQEQLYANPAYPW